MRNLTRFACLLTLTALIARAADTPATDPAASIAQTHKDMVAMYLDGRWIDLEGLLNVTHDSLLTAPDRAENLIIRQAMAECRPAWWDKTKPGKSLQFQANIWGRIINSTYDPNRTDMQLAISNGRPIVTIGWAAADMDSNARAEHGFTKGELLNLGIWNTLGMADGWAQIPVLLQTNLDAAGTARLQRYVDFRGDVAGIYYGSTRARRWGLWLYLYMYQNQYKDMVNVASRRAVGIFLMTEVISHPEKYPSMKIPADFKDPTEPKIADRLRTFLGQSEIPFAEDKALRDAVKAFAAANELTAFKSGQVILPNKLTANFDPKVDDALRPKREAWMKEQLAKPPATAPAK